MDIIRRNTRKIKVGNHFIGGNSEITVQSMCNTKTEDASSTIKQIHELEEAGCEIIRVAVPDSKAADALKEIKDNISIPLVADIHFDHKLAIASAKFVDKLRINPGNIGSEEKIKSVVIVAKEYGIPIRIGVNLGSLEKDIETKYGLTSKAMVKSALKNIRLLERFDFDKIIVSLKSSDVIKTIEANRMFSELSDYPIHLGVTEAGTRFSGSIKSAVCFSTLLQEGIGNTIRVSLSDNPIEEVKAGIEILKSLKLRKCFDIISCPTCARANFDVNKIAEQLESMNTKKPIKIAIMGCAVNGHGEAKLSDFGIVGGNGLHLFYKKGKIAQRIKESDIIDMLKKELN